MSEVKLSSILFANIAMTYWSVLYPVEMEGGGWRIAILASYKFYFIRIHDNLV